MQAAEARPVHLPVDDDGRVYLSDIEINLIAERAAAKAIEAFYIEVGKSVTKKAFMVVGYLVTACAVVIAGREIFNRIGSPP